MRYSIPGLDAQAKEGSNQMRNFKSLGLALAATLAMGAVASSAAQAEFTIGTGGNTVTVSQIGINEFFIPGFGPVECTSVTGDASASGTVADLTFILSYSGCTAFGQPLDIATDSCTFTLTTDSTVHICRSGGPLTMTVTSGGLSVCTLTFGAQTAAVTLHNKTKAATGKMDIEVTTGVIGLHYVVHNPNGNTGCPAAGTYTNGEYNGSLTITAENSSTGAAADITHSTPTKVHP
jgi:hypothetical protein